MQMSTLQALNVERAARRASVVVTDLDDGTTRLVLEADALRDVLSGELMRALRANKSGLIEVDGKRLFLTVQMPPVRIVVIGAVHISQALAPMAKLADFDVTIVDPRIAFASPERFPETSVVAEWPDVALPRLGLDRYTAFVALTHDPKIDDMGLSLALRSRCFYVGALGSRKSHEKRVARLIEGGLGEAETARIRAPVGLNIGAISPAEIAISILAEIVAALRAERVALKGIEGGSLGTAAPHAA